MNDNTNAIADDELPDPGTDVTADAYRVGAQRQQTYGSPFPNMAATAMLVDAYTKARLRYGTKDTPDDPVQIVRPEDEAALMILLKLGRVITGEPHRDNWLDIAGYAQVGAECQGVNDED